MPEAAERQRWLFTYAVDGDLRFISHHDTLRMFRRALARADLPVRHSEGFNPHPKVSIPLPRPVGIASESEGLVVEFDRPLEKEDAIGRLAKQMPGGVRILEARLLAAGERILPDWVRYHLEVDSPTPPDLPDRMRRLLDGERVEVQRTNHKDKRSSVINVRAFLMGLDSQADGVVFTLRVSGGGSARPAEIAGLLGFDAGAINHRIRRLEIRWK